MHECLDVESQRGTNGHDVFTVESFQDRRFTGVIEPSELVCER